MGYTSTRTTMDDERWTAVDDYVIKRLARPGAALEATQQASAAAGLPPIAVSAPQGKLLQLLATAQGSSAILEIGTLAGYSTIWLAGGLSAGGRVTTLEIDPRHAEIATRNIAHAGFSDRVEVRVGAALDTLAKLAAEGAGPFDLIFIDADKPSTPEYFAASLALSRPGTVILVDNVVRQGALADPASDDASVRGVQRLHELVAAEPRVSATTIQTVGSKGYDGFLLAVVLPG